MRTGGPWHAPHWVLFALPAAIAVPVLAGILLAGPAAGAVVAAALALTIVTVAIRARPSGQPGDTDPAPADPKRWQGAAARRMLLPLAIVVIGIVLIVAGDGGTLTIVGWGTFALALTVAISLVFLEVGYSEDRARGTDGPGTARRRNERTSR
jgi:hypothetical protein